MAEIPFLVKDLALILMVAGIVTLLFKKLKQPLVLGYIVAGFLVSPHMPYTMSVIDDNDIQTWADIGVHLHPVLARTRFLVQEDREDGSIAHHLHRRHRVLYDDAGHQRGSWIRLEQDGLHLPRRHACHEFHHHHL